MSLCQGFLIPFGESVCEVHLGFRFSPRKNWFPCAADYSQSIRVMSKKPFRSQASSSRAVSGAFGGASDGSAFGSNVSASTFGAVASSPLSYVYEPPDLSGFSEPSMGVACKNLQKKDGTTKSKALEELQNYISSLEADKGGLEDAVLEAWVCLLAQICKLDSNNVFQ